jgi:hypothetical protein
MNRVFSLLIIGGLLAAAAATPASVSPGGFGAVEAAPALAFISGTVSSDNGAPLNGATVALFETTLNGKLVRSVKTDTQGKFTASVAPGAYNLRAEASGYKAKFTRINLDRAQTLTFNFALKRTDTLVDRRGDRDDYRWIGRSVPRSVLHYDEDEVVAENTARMEKVEDRLTQHRPSIHGVAQFVGANSAARGNQPDRNFYGASFAISGSLNGNFEVALIGQGGAGSSPMQRLALIAAMRPDDKHHITTSLGYGRLALPSAGNSPRAEASSQPVLEQASVSIVDSWQAFQPLLIVYGFDYSRFVGSIGRNRESILPRVAVQYAPASNTLVRAAVTPGHDFPQNPAEGLNTENIRAATNPDAAFANAPAEVAFKGNEPLMDRSRRYEFGIERILGEGDSSLEATAFYDVISGHGVGVLALPLEATPATQAAFQQVAHQVAAMDGAARGMRVMYTRRFGRHLSAAAGYSFGRGERFSKAFNASTPGAPADLFSGGFFQVASAKLDLDLDKETGTTISTVIRLSPSAVVFAIDPFAGRLSVYDPNLSIYVTQNLPTFGLPFRCQAIVDVRNLFNQPVGTDDGSTQLVAARAQRTVRGGIAFRW